LYTFPISPMHATYSAYLILLDLITLLISGEAYKLWSSSLCSLFHPPTPSSFWSPDVPRQPESVFSLSMTKFHTCRKQQA
jgi:hypothetical protein